MKIESELSREAIKFSKMLRKIAKQDKGSLEEFYEEYGRFIYLSALSICKSLCLADEIVNDILVKIWNLSSQIKGIKNPKCWLYRITVNWTKDRLKSSRLSERPCEHVGDLFGEYDRGFEKLFDGDEFNYFINSLDEEEQEIIILRLVQGLSFDYIAKYKGKPISTVSSLYYRSLNKIKSKINNSEK